MPTDTSTFISDQQASTVGTPRTAHTLIYFFCFILLGMATSATGPSLPSLADQTASEIGSIGFLFMAASFCYMLGSLGSGWTYDRVPGHRLLGGALLLIAAMLALVPRIGSLAALTGVMFVLGLGEGTLDVGGNLLLVWLHRERAAPFLNGLHFFFGLGAMLIPVIVAQAILRSGSIEPAFRLMALLAIPLGIYALLQRSTPAQHQTAHEDRQPLDRVLVFMLSLVFFLYVGAEAGFGGWIYTYVRRLEIVDLAAAGVLTSAYWGALMVGRLAMIPMAHRIRPERLILLDFIGCVVSLALIVIFPTAAAAVWLGALGFGFFNGPIFPTMLAFAERRMAMSGAATSWFFVGTGAGGMFLPWLMGRLFVRLGPVSVIWAVLIDIVVGLAIFLFVNRLRFRVKPLSA